MINNTGGVPGLEIHIDNIFGDSATWTNNGSAKYSAIEGFDWNIWRLCIAERNEERLEKVLRRLQNKEY